CTMMFFINTAPPSISSLSLHDALPIFIFDVSDNISTFIDEHFGFALTFRYYATQVPEVFIILLPVSLLLALLFSLGRMSRANEIVSMLTAGVSIPRVLAPLIGMGLLTVAASFALNYSLAPHAEMAKKNFVARSEERRVGKECRSRWWRAQ